MKKFLSILLILLLVCGVFSGCTRKEQQTDLEQNNKTQIEETDKDVNEKNENKIEESFNSQEENEWKNTFKNTAYSFSQTSFVIEYTSGAKAHMYQDQNTIYMDISNNSEKQGILITKENNVFYCTMDKDKNDVWYKGKNVTVKEGQEFITEENGFNISYISNAFDNMTSLKFLNYEDNIAKLEIFFNPDPEHIKNPSEKELESLIVKIDIDSKAIHQVESSINGMVMTFVKCDDVMKELSFTEPTQEIDFQEAMNKFTSAFLRLSN